LGPRYTVASQLHIAASQPKIVFNTADSAASEGRSDFNTYQRTQSSRIKSRFVLNAALKRDDVKNLPTIRDNVDALGWLEEELKVTFQEGSEIVTVALTADDAGDAVAIVNAVTQAFIQEVINVERKKRGDRLTELDDVYMKLKEKIRAKRETLRRLADQVGTSDSQAMTQKQLILLSHYGDVKKQHAQIKFDLLRAKGNVSKLKAKIKKAHQLDVDEHSIYESIEADPEIKEYRLKVAKLQQTINHHEQILVNKDDPTLIKARQSLQSLQHTLEQRRAALHQEHASRLRQKLHRELQANVTQAQDEVATLTEHETTLAAELERLAKEAEKVGNSSTELEMLRAEIGQEQKVTERVGEELEALHVELRSPPRVSLYQEAALQKKEIRRLVMAMIAGPFGIFGLVAFGIAWLECRARRIQSTDEVVKGLGMRVVGAVPSLPNAGRGRWLEIHDPKDAVPHGLVESIDGIRTMLLRDASLEAMRLIMVTSAVHGEGKTQLAGHLAVSLARAGRRTLLVDCDLRSPAVHDLFDDPLQPGVSEVLLGEIALSDAVRPTSVDGLWMLPAGQWDREVIQALAKDGIRGVFAQLREEFDLVVIDSHPVLLATDALLIGQQVDAVIFSLLRDVSQVPTVYSASQRLSDMGIRVLGAVISGMHNHHYGHAQELVATAGR
jgi:capsular exopolysaccharide synthesis family protein